MLCLPTLPRGAYAMQSAVLIGKNGNFMLYLYTVLRRVGGGLWRSLAAVSITGQGLYSSIVVAAGSGLSAWRAKATTRPRLAYVFRSALGLKQSQPGGCCIVRVGNVGHGPASVLRHRLKSSLWYRRAGRSLRCVGLWHGWPGSHRGRAAHHARRQRAGAVSGHLIGGARLYPGGWLCHRRGSRCRGSGANG